MKRGDIRLQLLIAAVRSGMVHRGFTDEVARWEEFILAGHELDEDDSPATISGPRPAKRVTR